MPVVAISRVLREKLGEDGVDSLVDLFNKSEQKVKEDVIALSAEKFERRLAEEISGVRSDLVILEGKFETRITSLEARIDKRITDEISQLRQEISQVRQETSQLRQEISQVRQETSQLRQETSQVRQEISQLRQETSQVRQDFTSLEARIDKRITDETSKIRVEMSLFKSEIIKWMFLFWIGQLACVAGIVNWLK